MSATAQTEAGFSPVGKLAGWARQGFESFVAAQKILLDLTAQQNALVIGVMRERLGVPREGPGKAIAAMADKSVANLANAGKILLDLASIETALVAEGVKEGLRLPVAGAVADVVRHRVETLVDMEKRMLDATVEQSHMVAESYKDGEGSVLVAGMRVAELARQGLEEFFETEKKFLDLAAKDVSNAVEGREGHKAHKDRVEVLADLARKGADQFVDAQKKLMHLAIDQVEASRKAAGEAKVGQEMAEEARTTLAKLTEKGVQNFVAAQKSLIELAVKPIQTPAAENGVPKAVRRPRHKNKK